MSNDADAAGLRGAAKLLRGRAGAEFLPPAPWQQTGRMGSEWDDIVDSPASNGIVADCDTSNESAAYIAMMHPHVALALADLLAETSRYPNSSIHRPMLEAAKAVADTILVGGA